MIINTGCRTDIPAFYSKWLMNRIREGFVYVRNPYYKSQVTKYSLSPNVVDCLAFCTKNPEPMLKYLDELDVYKQYWFVTITPYGKDIEPVVPDKEKLIESFKKLSEHIGVNSTHWRYDPIFIGMGYNIEKHIEELTIHSCCEKTYLAEYGIDCKGCMSQEIVEKGIGTKLNPPKRKSLREDCNCLMENDIGAYNTCGHLCKYCYANANVGLVKENMKKNISTSPFLIGGNEEGDKIIEAKQKSWKTNKSEQISLI